MRTRLRDQLPLEDFFAVIVGEKRIGIQGKAPRRRSSMLGCVAAVIAMVSPSQPRPAVIQRI
jgi:hypothetical protein